MMQKSFFILQVLVLLKAITAYPCGPCSSPLAADILALEEIAAASGGAFIVTTGSPIPPTGISVLSENSFEGMLLVEGQLPFIGTVGFEGALPTAGAGTVSYGCGNGNIGMVAEDIVPNGFAGRAYGGRGIGCGALL